jgi:hypothetical protein
MKNKERFINLLLIVLFSNILIFFVIGGSAEKIFSFLTNPLYLPILATQLVFCYLFLYIVKSKKPNNKVDVPRLIFIISLILYLPVIIFLLYSSIYGIERIRPSWGGPIPILYGLEAFREAIQYMLIFSYFIPVSQMILQYQIIYVLFKKNSL